MPQWRRWTSAASSSACEPLAGVLAHRLQHEQTAFRAGAATAQEQLLVHQSLQRVEVGAGHRLGGLDRGPAGEHGEPARTPRASGALRRRWLQSIVARSVRWRSGASRGPPPSTSSARASRAFSCSAPSIRCGPRPARSRAAGRRAGGRSRRSRRVASGQLEAWLVAAGALDEQRAGRGLLDAAGWPRPGRRAARRVAVLGLQPQRLAAGRQHLGQRGPGGQQIADQAGRGQDVLEVVEHQQPVLGARKRTTASFGVSPSSGVTPSACAIALAHVLRVSRWPRARRTMRRRGARARARGRPPAPAASCPPRRGR